MCLIPLSIEVLEWRQTYCTAKQWALCAHSSQHCDGARLAICESKFVTKRIAAKDAEQMHESAVTMYVDRRWSAPQAFGWSWRLHAWHLDRWKPSYLALSHGLRWHTWGHEARNTNTLQGQRPTCAENRMCKEWNMKFIISWHMPLGSAQCARTHSIKREPSQQSTMMFASVHKHGSHFNQTASWFYTSLASCCPWAQQSSRLCVQLVRFWTVLLMFESHCKRIEIYCKILSIQDETLWS